KRIARTVRAFVSALYASADLDFEAHRAGSLFAIHPGGPRVVDAVESALDLTGTQVKTSRDVLHRYGNMSSATLPHVWMEILPSCEPGTVVASLAFGPGLTMAGALLVRA
ncbi:MAG: 3-oxoacyl-[acyl-carrier-protein] synthase III C-terminal domain-containing protein, partial [Polyangiaceae bacterium]